MLPWGVRSSGRQTINKEITTGFPMVVRALEEVKQRHVTAPCALGTVGVGRESLRAGGSG